MADYFKVDTLPVTVDGWVPAAFDTPKDGEEVFLIASFPESGDLYCFRAQYYPCVGWQVYNDSAEEGESNWDALNGVPLQYISLDRVQTLLRGAFTSQVRMVG